MNRHALVFYLSDSDPIPQVRQEPHAVETHIDFFLQGKLRFGLASTLASVRSKGLRPSDHALDLLLLATAVYLADTRVSRKQTAQDGWTRELDLYLPVHDVAQWHDATPTLETILNFLTGDLWRLHFRAFPTLPRPLVATPSAGAPDIHHVALMSGGLDSYVGAINDLASGLSPLFVGHNAENTTSHYQRLVEEHLEGRHGGILYLRHRINAPNGLIEGTASEDSQRSRSFLFFALAILVASGFGRPLEVLVPENGFISLNVPLDRLRLGARSTRTTHPHLMGLWNLLLERLEFQVQLRNPFQFQTKGQMLAQCKDRAFLQRGLEITMSCSSPNKARWQGLEPTHCGTCLPCLIRRAAIHSAFADDPTRYVTTDLQRASLASDQAEGIHIRSFQLAFGHLRRRPSSSRIVIHKPGPLKATSAELDAYAQVYSNGLTEVGQFLESVRTKPT